MKVAVLFSPQAGGSKKYAKLAKVLEAKLLMHEIFTYEGLYGGIYLERAHVISGASHSENYVQHIRSIAEKIVETNPEILVSVGGDGFASYIAETMIQQGRDIPLAGIAGGTANVGPIVSIKPEELDRLDLGEIRYTKIGAIEVSFGNSIRGYGFNDVIIGDTFLGTLDGEASNIAIKPFLTKGIKKKAKPSDKIVSETFIIKRNGQMVNCKMRKPSQIVISPIENLRLYGKAATGALCLASLMNKGAALSLVDYVIVSTTPDSPDNRTITTEHLLLDDKDLVTICGLSDKGQVVIDGNPFMRGGDEEVEVRYISRAVTIADIGRSL